MCGIVGVISPEIKNDHKIESVHLMNTAIHHRGPDEDGFYSDDLCSLAMKRLSIIDLSGGSQPIYDPSGKYLIFFNGEIYNYKSLRKQLLASGHSFTTESDTEVVLQLYISKGKSALQDLRGMYAFCIYHIEEKSFFFCRDRFGERPFYYYHDGVHFAFASEFNALLKHKQVPRKMNTEVIEYYMATMMVPEPLTFIEGVKSLPPGHYAEYSEGSLTVSPYFEIDYTVDHKIADIDEAIAFIEPKLATAISRQTVSDVPIGAFLSGGIDSSTVVSYLTKYSENPIDTFTVKFSNQSYDESQLAQEIADYYGTRHHTLEVKHQGFTMEMLNKIIDHCGPFPDSSAIPTYLISQEISKHVKVAVGGDGGDELFGGYLTHQWWQCIDTINQKLPDISLRVGSSILKMIQSLGLARNSSKVRQIYRGVMTANVPLEHRGVYLHQLFDSKQYKDLRQRAYDFSTHDAMSRFPDAWYDWSPLRQAMYFRSKYNLPTDMLIKTDRMAMANSLEVRVPFLDYDLYDASRYIADDLLVHNGKGKYILRQMMKNKLPEGIFNQPKQGFALPLREYFNEEYFELALNLFKDNPIISLFEQNALMDLHYRCMTQMKDDIHSTVYRTSHMHWALVLLFAWSKRYEVSI